MLNTGMMIEIPGMKSSVINANLINIIKELKYIIPL